VPADDSAGRRQAVLVSGMHRSGTSVMTRLISLLGAELPGRLIEGRPHDNARGFFEGKAFVDLDDDTLGRLGSWWGGWQSVDPADLLRRRRLIERAASLVDDEFGGADLVVIKDPRMSRLLPLWQQVLGDAGFRCVHVVAVRAPEAVAASLARRNHLGDRAVVLSWLAHSLDAELFTRDEPRVFLSFERLLDDWRREAARMSDALGLEWAHRPEDVADAVEEFVESGLVHGADPEAPTGAVGAVAPVYDVLRRWAADDVRPGDAALLDEWRAALDPVRAPASAVAGVARERKQAIAQRDAGAPAVDPPAAKQWIRMQNRGYDAEADAAWAWWEREREHGARSARPGGRLARLARRGPGDGS
jgi:hypothetical protein